MALEPIEQRQDRAQRDAEHEARQAEAIAQEQKVLDEVHARADRTPAEKIADTQQTSRNLVAQHEAKQDTSAYEDKMQRDAGETKEEGDDDLDSVAFASPAAREAAKGLSADVFKRRRKSSDRGFTVADVERIRAATGESDEDEE